MSAPVPGGADVRLATAADLPSLAPLWRRFYEDQRAQGMRAVVPENGFAEWEASIRPVLERFGVVVLGVRDSEPVGFVAGRVRSLPRHLGGVAAGLITEVWVEPVLRGHGLGAAMVEAAMAWFRGQGVRRLELQVVVGNEAARRLYARLGFAEELTQMVREE